MSTRTNPDMPVGRLSRIKDILPPPERLVIPKETVKVTLLLSKSSVMFFKHKATQHRIKYQQMIRELVDRYAQQYSS